MDTFSTQIHCEEIEPGTLYPERLEDSGPEPKLYTFDGVDCAPSYCAMWMAHFPGNNSLVVRFKPAREDIAYQYPGVTREDAEAIAAASSPGAELCRRVLKTKRNIFRPVSAKKTLALHFGC